MAALTAPITGNGTTITGLGWTTFITKISGLEEVIGTWETSDLSTTGFKTIKKQDLAENPEVTCEGFWTGATITNGAEGTFTITWPSAGSYAGTGIITNVKFPDAENGNPLKCSFKVKFDGYTGPALTAA